MSPGSPARNAARSVGWRWVPEVDRGASRSSAAKVEGCRQRWCIRCAARHETAPRVTVVPSRVASDSGWRWRGTTPRSPDRGAALSRARSVPIGSMTVDRHRQILRRRPRCSPPSPTEHTMRCGMWTAARRGRCRRRRPSSHVVDQLARRGRSDLDRLGMRAQTGCPMRAFQQSHATNMWMRAPVSCTRPLHRRARGARFCRR